jgi:hypothetical protein
MQEELKMNDFVRAEMLNKRLVEIQSKLKVAKKFVARSATGSARYNYRNCEQVLEAVKPLLGDLSLVLSDEAIAVGDRVYIKATARLSDGVVGIDATACVCEEREPKHMSVGQSTGATSSYARKYALCGLFAIDSGGKDIDALPAKSEQPKEIDLGIPCTQAQLDRIAELGSDVEQVKKYYKTKTLTEVQAKQVIAMLERRKGDNKVAKRV